MATNPTEKERKAWAEVEKRLGFLVKVISGKDVTMSRMAIRRLSEALESHAPAYDERMKFEVEKKKKKIEG